MSILSSVLDAVGGDAPQKVRIAYEQDTPGQYDGEFEALFNPSQLRFTKEISWDIKALAGQSVLGGFHHFSFQETRPKSLSIELFFDTYEGPPPSTGGGLLGGLADAALSVVAAFNPLPGVSAVDVTPYTQQVANLGRIQKELHRPPRCKLTWGSFPLIHGVLTSLHEDYTFFLPNGMPVRATLACTFTETLDEDEVAELHSADVAKQWVVKRGDTLAGIAQASYQDARRWRVIAEANGIDNPRRLTPGQALIIPPLGAPGRGRHGG